MQLKNTSRIHERNNMKHSSLTDRSRPRLLAGLLAVLVTLLSSGCSSLIPESEAQRQFMLGAAEPLADNSSDGAPAVTDGMQKRWPRMSIRVALNSRFDTNRLLMLSSEQELMPYQGARWALALPELLRERWSQALEDSELVGLSYGEGSKQGLRPALVIHLREFQARLLGANRAECQVALALEFLSDERGLPQSRHFQAKREVSTEDAAQVAAGFNQAHEEILQQALHWLAQQ